MNVGVYEAKTHLPALLRRVARGERVTITRHGKPVAELGPANTADNTSLREAVARLDALREDRPVGRQPLSTAEILRARDEGRR